MTDKDMAVAAALPLTPISVVIHKDLNRIFSATGK